MTIYGTIPNLLCIYIIYIFLKHEGGLMLNSNDKLILVTDCIRTMWDLSHEMMVFNYNLFLPLEEINKVSS